MTRRNIDLRRVVELTRLLLPEDTWCGVGADAGGTLWVVCGPNEEVEAGPGFSYGGFVQGSPDAFTVRYTGRYQPLARPIGVAHPRLVTREERAALAIWVLYLSHPDVEPLLREDGVWVHPRDGEPLTADECEYFGIDPGGRDG